MKKIIPVFCLCFLCISFSEKNCEAAAERGLFVTVLQEPQVLSSRKEILRLIDFAKKAHIRILFVQIYRANKAWFPSRVADSRPYEVCLKNVSRDPLALLISEAHKSGIEVHAWLNLLSLSNNKDAKILKKYGLETLTRNLKKKRTIEDYKIDKQYFLEPGDLRVRSELLAVVNEILHNYPKLDGIQFDYIRYPDRNPSYGYTKNNIERFKKATGNKVVKEDTIAWQNWKRKQVTELLTQLVKRARALHPDIRVSATGCAPFVRAYYEAFQDWPSWVNSGLVDFVTVMTYSDKVSEFEKYANEAKKKIITSGKINLAIGAYKFKNHPENFTQEFNICEKSGNATCVILGYGDLVKNSALQIF
ncbi:MAG: family 10 glycosylhydrolase [Candidatus Omnitrophica bacterium]|jgi:uncharacterized lipoprotein YddW (UPF0748 family)|nr:family 10 glycosylhydrolase [Candidatus Omnitrophota bacterium]